MHPEPFDFSCTVSLPDGSQVVVQQTDVERAAVEETTFYVAVRVGADEPFTGALHLSRSSLGALDASPGATRAERSALVTDALADWVRDHGLTPEFTLDVVVRPGHRRQRSSTRDLANVCEVSIALPRRS